MTGKNREKKYQPLQYTPGQYDLRPWGFWVVTDASPPAEDGFCEKLICVAPGRILSLQSHLLRRETWTVLSGTLRVIVGDRALALEAGQSIDIPKGAAHCMANTGTTPCIVRERQAGLCLESDIIRHLDAYGRAGGEKISRVTPAINLYLDLLDEIEGRQKRHA